MTRIKIVAGINLRNLEPRVWDKNSPYHLPNLQAIMVSYADFAKMPVRRRRAMEQGLHAYLGIPEGISIYLDNGAFYFSRKGGKVPWQEYEQFVRQAQPDWYAMPQDYIPTPQMSDEEQLACLQRTMEVNRAFRHDGYVPVLHISRHLGEYLNQFLSDERLHVKPIVALGGIVPNLLRAPNAMSYENVLDKLRQARTQLANKELHVFGIGGTATLHLAALLGVDSVDSSGWRSRAARGLVQMPGRGDRSVANHRVRAPDKNEWDILASCLCPACQQFGVEGLRASGLHGFCCRATHNLWTLLDEAQQIGTHLADSTYKMWYGKHVENSVYRPLIDYVLR